MTSDVLKMDKIDKQIIQIVQEHPNLTHTQIALKVNRSQPTVGIRMKRLEKAGVLQFQAGINMRSANLYFARVDLQTTNPEKVYKVVKNCPFMFNAFRLSGKRNISVLLASFKLEDLDKIVNNHFRNKAEIKNVSMDIITNVVSNLILPLDLNFGTCDICLKDECEVIPKTN